MLRLELDYETFWLHCKGLVHYTSLPHVISTEPATQSCDIHESMGCVCGWGERCSRLWDVSETLLPIGWALRKDGQKEPDLGEQGLQLRPGQREVGVGHRLSLPRAE